MGILYVPPPCLSNPLFAAFPLSKSAPKAQGGERRSRGDLIGSREKSARTGRVPRTPPRPLGPPPLPDFLPSVHRFHPLESIWGGPRTGSPYPVSSGPCGRANKTPKTSLIHDRDEAWPRNGHMIGKAALIEPLLSRHGLLPFMPAGRTPVALQMLVLFIGMVCVAVFPGERV